MNKKGFTLIENLLFFSTVILLVTYLLMLAALPQKIREFNIDKDEIYEKAYQ